MPPLFWKVQPSCCSPIPFYCCSSFVSSGECGLVRVTGLTFHSEPD
uniref:Uncharacterized protein n=1 Tax=Anguilla anguilla TaxID=7936 RepID=A0A0E9RGJ3_ANGAN